MIIVKLRKKALGNKVLPTTLDQEIDEEIASLERDVCETAGKTRLANPGEDDPEYWINPEETDGTGAVTVNAGKVLKPKEKSWKPG